MIQLTPASENPELFYKLAKDYIKTLHNFDRRVIWSNGVWEKALLISRFIENDGEVIGFATWCPEDLEGHDPILHIKEFFIASKYRRKGYGRKAVHEIVKDWNKYVYLYIQDRNMVAKSFWADVERNLGWFRMEYKDIKEEPGCNLRVYKQSAGKKGAVKND